MDFNNLIEDSEEIISNIFEFFDNPEINQGVVILGNYIELPKEISFNLIGSLLNLVILSNNKINFLPLWPRGNLEGVYQNISYDNTCSKEYIFQKIRERKIKALYLTERIKDTELLKNIEFLIIQDIYPSDNFRYANIILPSLTFIEDSGTLLNSELRLQKVQKSAFVESESKSDWIIFCDLAKIIDTSFKDEFNFQNSDEILEQISKFNPYFKIHSSNNKTVSSFQKLLYIPDLSLNFTPLSESVFNFEFFKYRGEPLSNQVPDLKALTIYKSLENEEVKLITKEKPLIETDFEIIKNDEIAPNLYILIIKAPLIAEKAKPGNFILLMQYEDSERIPLTLSDWDAKNETITLFYQEVGYSTKELTNLKGGDYLYSVVGPLGKEIEIHRFGTILIGGGCYGNGAIYPIAKAMKEAGNKVIIILESKNEKLFYLEEELAKFSDQIIYCTSDGSKGLKGKIKTGIEYLMNQNFKIDRCYFIGCIYMMMEASNTTKIYGEIPTFVSLNTIMIDGTGMCGSCRLTLNQDGKDITKFACVDGPTFNGHLVNWNELIKRRTALYENEIRVYQKDTCKALEKK
jgi:NAD(P)H-flavin reductase